jgi:hypothetical protein
MAILRMKGRKRNRRRKIKCKTCNDHDHHPHHNHQKLPTGNCRLKLEIPGVSKILQAAPSGMKYNKALHINRNSTPLSVFSFFQAVHKKRHKNFQIV